MSVSVAEMVRSDHERAESSKKRKYINEERAERKEKKRSKHAPVTDEHVEASATESISAVPHEEQQGRSLLHEEISGTAVTQQEASADVRPFEVEDDGAAPATAKNHSTPKKKKRKVVVESQESEPTPATTESADIELPDLDAEDETSITPLPFTNGTTSTAQQPLLSDSTEDSPFHTTRTSLYVPCPAISLSTALPSLISTHLTPLILTYYGPLDGVVLSVTDVTISSKAAAEPSKPLLLPSTSSHDTQFALCADSDGVSFTWLTATFTLFRPQPSSQLSGYINVSSEDFIGVVLYNYFQVGIPRSRIPKTWRWHAPGSSSSSSRGRKRPKKGRIRDAESEDTTMDSAQESEPLIPDGQATVTAGASAHDTNTGFWTTSAGAVLSDSQSIQFRVVDVDVVPSSNARFANSLALQVEGTLLDGEEEDGVRAEEKARFERAQNKAHGRAVGPGSREQGAMMMMMSGGLAVGQSREGSVASSLQRHRVAY